MTDPLADWRILGGMSDSVNHPSHYAHPSGVEAIDICEHLTFNLGNALKYLWRAGKKGPAAEDYRKAAWYLRREVAFQQRPGRRARYVVSREAQEKAALAVAHTIDEWPLRCLLAAICNLNVTPEEFLRVADDCDRGASELEGARAARMRKEWGA